MSLAGRLLVPVDELQEQFEAVLQEMEQKGMPRGKLRDEHLS